MVVKKVEGRGGGRRQRILIERIIVDYTGASFRIFSYCFVFVWATVERAYAEHIDQKCQWPVGVKMHRHQISLLAFIKAS